MMRSFTGRWISIVCLCLAVVWGTPFHTHAQSPGDVIQKLNEGERIQREDEIRRKMDLEKLREKAPQKPLEMPSPELKKMEKKGRTWTLKEIVLEGADQLSSSTKNELTEGYLNRPIYVADINDLLNDITLYYFQKGYISSRVYIIPKQNIAAGTLRLKVEEGKLEEITQKEGKGGVNLHTAFPFLTGDVLNLRDIEQGLDQINRLSSNNAAMKVLPGSQDGLSRILVSNEKKFPLSGYVTYDNMGLESTGEHQIGLGLIYDNPFFLNDSLAVSGRIPISGGSAQKLPESVPGSEDKFSTSLNLNYSVPLGYTTFSGGASRSEYSIPVDLQSGTRVYSEGKTTTYNFDVKHLIYRDQTTKIDLSAKLTAKDSKSYLMGELLEVSSRKLTIIDAGAGLETRLWGGLFTTALGCSLGTEWLGAKEDEGELENESPHAQFIKPKLDMGYYLPIPLWGTTLWSSSLSAQYCNEGLYGSEQISVGGHYSVRGYQDVSISGDSGFYMRNDLIFDDIGILQGIGVAIKPYIGLDAGYAHSHAGLLDGSQEEWIAGAAAGIKFSHKYISTEVSAVQSLVRLDESYDDKYEDMGVFVTATVSF